MNLRVYAMFILFSLVTAAVSNAEAPVAVGSHGGTIVSKAGKSYEVVLDHSHHQVTVYSVPGQASGAPKSEMVLKIKKGDTFLEKIHLKLTNPSDPARSNYTGLIPASVVISGGVTFDFDF